jgi:hypothetical protein
VRGSVIRVLLACGIVASLSLGLFTASAQASVARPEATSGQVCKKITGPGEVCIGWVMIRGLAYLKASYKYEGSHSTRGHVRLGAVGIGRKCGPGVLLKNGPTVTLKKNKSSSVEARMLVDSYWSSTWYNGKTDWGSVCAVF